MCGKFGLCSSYDEWFPSRIQNFLSLLHEILADISHWANFSNDMINRLS